MAVTAAAALLALLMLAEVGGSPRCPTDTLVTYRARLSTHWTRDAFPKQYPEFRPPAQWSRLLGRSHDASFELFSEGRLASPALKLFSEVGRTDLFDVHRQGFEGVMDTFGAEAIAHGEGTSTAKFHADSNHSLVSLVVRMVPSPDWFVGANSINLCADGHWVDEKLLKLPLMDAGTDTGFTFTSPNWPSDPPQPISVITARMPDHPASSFYYPDLNHLPVIATLQFNKVKVYKLQEDFSYREEGRLPGESKQRDVNDDDAIISNQLQPMPAVVSPGGLHALSIGSADANRRRLARNKLRTLRVRRLKQHRNGTVIRRPMREECVLSKWSDWSACSASCGNGSSKRQRSVLKRGRQCPGTLEESSWCSSYEACSGKYFKW